MKSAGHGQNIEVTRLLATHAATLRWETIPAAVVHDAKRALVDFEGVALAGSSEPLSTALQRVYAARSGAAEARMFGTGRRADVMTAAFLNGAAGHALDFDDTHADFFYHGTVPVAPAVWALGEMLGTSGREMIVAFVAGWDIGARLARALNPSIYRKGWQNTPTSGAFAAAAAAGRILKLDSEAMCHALGMAASQASGSRQNHGSMGKPFQVGKAAMNGVLAALAAREGITSSTQAIEGPLGFAALTAPEFDLSLAVANLGERFELRRNMFKAYACCLPHHAVIDGMFALRREHGVTPATLETAACRVPAISLDSSNIAEPVTGLEGKFSFQHSAAVALTDDAAGIAQYTTERVLDAALARVRRKISLVPDASLPAGQCTIEARRSDGATVTVTIEHARGHLANPLSDADIDAKFCANTAAVKSEAWQSQALEALWTLDRATDVASVAALL
ncbi:2-methylcitrate dehydratase PrpD [Paraburkholderia sp. GAS199]|uniref:MmgE/PrpD family protein n=1 Tax=Paraburkholderia sp. GAS199 TaxID=3035126 RepID=UPI003D21ABCD